MNPKIKPGEEVRRFENETESFSVVRIHAHHLQDRGDGTFDIFLKGRNLTDEERKVLHTLFPHLEENVHQLLAKEALLQSVE